MTTLPSPTGRTEPRVPSSVLSGPEYHTTHIHLPREPVDPTLYWAIIGRHLFLISAIFFSSFLLTIVIILNTTPTYTGSATILVQPRIPEILGLNKSKGNDVDLPTSYQHDYYETQYDILRSRSLAAHVIRDLHLVDAPWLTLPHSESVRPIREPLGQLEVPASIIDVYQERLHINPQIGTRLVTVLFAAPDPALAASIANAHVRAYINRGLELNAEAGKNALQFLQRRLSELKDRVAVSEKALNDYRRNRGIVSSSLDNEAANLLIRRLADLNTDLDKAEEAKAQLEGERQLIASGDYESLPEVMHSSLIQSLKQQSAELGEQYAKLSNRFNPGYHELDDLKAQLDESQARLRKETQRAIAGTESEYRIQVARQAKLTGEIEQVKNEAMAMSDAAVEDAVLSREVETNRALYLDVLRRIQEIQLSANEPSTNISVLDKAEPSRWPSSPKVIRDLVVGGLLGLVGSLGAAFFIEFLDDRLRSGSDVQRYLRVPNIGIVREFDPIPGRGSIAKAINSQFGSAPSTLKSVRPLPLKEIVVGDSESSNVAEDFRAIRNAVLFASSVASPTRILITSAISGEGKTVATVNLAIAFAHIGKRVLLIDADLRRPRCHVLLNLDNEEGLTDVLSHQKQSREVIKSTGKDNLFFLSAGPIVSNPGEFLVLSGMRELVNGLNREYDYLLIDSSPIVPVTDCESIATLVDGVLLVASSRSPKSLVRDACLRLELIGANTLGVILNRVRARDLAYPYLAYSYNSYVRAAVSGRDGPA
jgi:capsular exopolysaccharide synthesis family protein